MKVFFALDRSGIPGTFKKDFEPRCQITRKRKVTPRRQLNNVSERETGRSADEPIYCHLFCASCRPSTVYIDEMAGTIIALQFLCKTKSIAFQNPITA